MEKREKELVGKRALREGKILAPLTFEGSCNRDFMIAWLSQSLIPQLNPGEIIIVDNATFHLWRKYQRNY